MSDSQDRTDDLVRWAMDAEAPADVEGRLRDRLSEFKRRAARPRPARRCSKEDRPEGRDGRRSLPGGAAAGLALAVIALLGWLSMGRPDAVSWAQVLESTRQAPWVHTVQKDATTGQVQGEAWTQTSPPRRFHSPISGRRMQTVLIDYAARERWWYTPHAQALTIRAIAEDEAPPSVVFLDVLDPEKRPPQVESVRQAEVADGLIRFEVFFRQEDGQKPPRRAMQVWVDAATGLPARAEAPGETGQPERVYLIDYPETGPADVFDLGVPRVARVQDARPPADLERIVAAYRACRAAFPERYRAVMATDEGISYVIEKDGRKERRQSYFPPVGRATPEVLEAWVDLLQEGTVPPDEVTVFDGKRTVDWDIDKGRKVYRRRERGLLAQGLDHQVKGDSLVDQPMHRITSDDPELEGMVGIRIEGLRDHKGRERGDEFWLNPARDYLVHRFLWRVKDEDGWHVLERIQVLEYARLPSGQWYRRRWRTVATHVDYTTYLDIQVSPEFAEGTFDVDAPSPWGSAVLDVVDAEGQPVEDVQVVALDFQDLCRWRVDGARVTLSCLQPGRPLEFLLGEAERGLAGKAVVTVQRGDTVRQEVTLNPGIRLSGSMVDVDGFPVPGAQAHLLVRLHSDLPIPLGRYCGYTETETDAAGLYELGALQPDLEYVIQPRKAGLSAAQCEVEVGKDEGVAHAEEIVLTPRTASLAGRVTTDDDMPLESLEVVRRLRTPAPGTEAILRSPRSFGAEGTAETDAVGDYRFDGLLEGNTYLLYVRAPGYEDMETEVTPGDEPVNFVLTPLLPGVPVEPTE